MNQHFFSYSAKGNPIPKIKALALDLDGTLLNSHHEISRPNLEALEKAHQTGVKIVIASGRMTPSIHPVIKNITVPCSIIAYNGAKMLEMKSGAWQAIISTTLPPSIVKQAIALSEECKWLLNIYRQDKLYGYQREGYYRWADFYTNATGSVYHIKTRTRNRLPSTDVTKLLIVSPKEDRDTVFRKLNARFTLACMVVKSQPEYTEVIPAHVSKASALNQWCQIKGISPTRVAAMGDAENDLDLLQFAGLGIAVANATPGLKATFPNVSQWTNDEDAVARELERLLGKEN